MRFRYFGFRSTLLTVVIAALVLSLSVAGFLSYSYLETQVSERLINDLHAEMGEEANDILSLFKRAENATTDLTKLIEEGNYSVKELPELLALSAKVGGVSKFTFGLSDGTSYASRASNTFPGGVAITSKYDPRTRPWYKEAQQSPGLSHSTPFFTRSTNQPMLAVSHTIKYGSLNGVLVADLRFSNLQGRLESLLEEKEMIGFIVDKSGLIIASTIESVEPNKNLADSPLSQFANQLRHSESTSLDYELNGETMLFIDEVIPLINGGEWNLVVAVNKAKAYQPLTSATTKLLTAFAITAVLAIIILSIVMNIIYRPILSLRSIVTGLSQGDGDLTQRLEVNSNDDLGAIASGINKFIENLDSMIIEVKEGTDRLSSGVENLRSYSADSAGILDQHQLETNQVVTAMDELGSTASLVAENASEAAKFTQEANQSGATSKQTILSAQRSLEQLVEEVERATDNVTRMSDETQDISSILSVIGGIAEQTNLLALNAAIEAARAGEQGRGFAVVADEVRALAARTQDSTGEIEKALAKLQEGADSVVTSIGSTKQTSESTVEEAAGISESLETMTGYVTKINDLSLQISVSADEQNVVIQDISKNMNSIHTMVGELTTNGSTVQGEIDHLAEINNQLNSVVNRFKLSK